MENLPTVEEGLMKVRPLKPKFPAVLLTLNKITTFPTNLKTPSNVYSHVSRG